MKRFSFFSLMSASLLLQGAFLQAAQPDTIYYNGKIVTLDAKDSIAEAVAIQDGKFLQTGTNEEIKKLEGPTTKVLDLKGKTVVPGLIDAHCHPMETIMMKESWVDCRFPQTRSVAQSLKNISNWVAKTPKDTWILAACVSASENKFAEKRLPTKAELDSVAPNNPLLVANGTHMFIVNSAALQQLGIKKGVNLLPHGGAALLDKNNEPTGVLTDAMDDVPLVITEQQLQQYYTNDIQKLWNRYGFTSFLALTPAEVLPSLQKVAQSHFKPTIRYFLGIWDSANGTSMPDKLQPFYLPKEADPEWYQFIGIKRWVDGENDCRTGYMYEPYLGHFDTDPPGGRGSVLGNQKELNHFVDIATKNKVACLLHCSGDEATDMGLSAFEQVEKTNPHLKRIEHFGMFQLTPKQLQRAKELKDKGLKVCVQPTWLLDLVKSGFENIGKERAKTGFQFGSMVKAGLEPAAGTDMTGIYLENINPFMAIYALVTRNSDMGVFQPEQAVSVQEALKMWTLWAAKSMKAEDRIGSIEPGKYADMTVLSNDIFSIPTEKLQNVKAIQTVVGGRLVYECA